MRKVSGCVVNLIAAFDDVRSHDNGDVLFVHKVVLFVVDNITEEVKHVNKKLLVAVW